MIELILSRAARSPSGREATQLFSGGAAGTARIADVADKEAVASVPGVGDLEGLAGVASMGKGAE